jgi:hypothetical protein
LIRYKYEFSAKKAFKKANLSENSQAKNLKIDLVNNVESDELEKTEDNTNRTGRVVYLKYSDSDKVPEKEEAKKFLKKYGQVTKIYRKKVGKSYYVEFSSESSASDLLGDYQSGIFKMKNLIELNYAFNKTKEKELTTKSNIDDISEKLHEKRISSQSNNFENPERHIPKVEKQSIDQKDQIQQQDGLTDNKKDQIQNYTENPLISQTNKSDQHLDPNKHWQVFFDQTYQMNYYYNPFFNQSVWELPQGAELTPYQETNLYYDPQVNTDNQGLQQSQALPLTEEPQVTEREANYYDDEAWEEDELMEKLVWDKMKEQQLKEWMKRPARQQVADTRRDTAYIEGNYDYNIWYDKYLTDRKEEKEKIPALHRCNPGLDTGFTKADTQEKEGGAYFCMFFAKGCCSEGVNCRYYHRVPTKENWDKIENLRDVFGRSRFAQHRNDMGGVGTFTKECRSLFVSDLKMVDTANPVKEMVRILYENFSPWGEIEDINYIPAKATCFIRFSHRCSAEFAKEAMMGQSLVGEEILTVKWAYDDPNPMNKKRTERENENRFLSLYNTKQENLKKIMSKGSHALPNVDYKNFYESRNKNNQIDFSAGYGRDENDYALPENRSNYPVTDEPTSNYARLSETLKWIDEMNEQENENQ